jgi:hypothetical protein
MGVSQNWTDIIQKEDANNSLLWCFGKIAGVR